MWIHSENGDGLKPPVKEPSGDYVIVRRNFKNVPASEEISEHWEYEEWQMTKETYDVYSSMIDAIAALV
jgi:hypothetical protein